MNNELIEMENKAHKLNLMAWRLKERRKELEGVISSLIDQEIEINNLYFELVDQIYDIKFKEETA